MQQTCTDIGDCKYPSVRALLEGSHYFKGNGNSCRCVERRSVYSSEWDSERNEYWSRWSEGISRAVDVLERLLKLEKINIPESEKIAESIPKKFREKTIEAIRVFKNVELPQSIVRILIYSGNIYNGFINITPLLNIDDAFLKPPQWMEPPEYWVTCRKQFTPERILRPDPKETVECVPYVHIGIEDRIGVCAQYAVRLALMNLLQRVPTVPELTSTTRHQPQGGGWTAEQITEIMSKAIRYEGLTPFRYSSSKCPICNEPLPNTACPACGEEMHSIFRPCPTKENIYAYVESGIPVLLGVDRTGDLPWWEDESIEEGHALVAIGHTLSDKGDVNGFIVHDVSTYPYQVLREPFRDNKSFEEVVVEAIVPVYRDIEIDYPWAKELASQTIRKLRKGDSFRPLLVEANKIKKWLAEGEPRDHFLDYSIDEKVKECFSRAIISRYNWLFEIKRELGNGKRKYIGDIIISAEEPTVLGFNFPLKGRCGYIDEISREIITADY